jgi:type IV secretory pathway VirB6-like protein
LYPSTGDRKAAAHSPEEAMHAYINDLIRYFKEFKYPITEEAIDAYSTYVMKALAGYGIPGSLEVETITAEQSRPFIDAIMKFYKDKSVNFKFFGLLHQYLLGKKSGVFSINTASCQ